MVQICITILSPTLLYSFEIFSLILSVELELKHLEVECNKILVHENDALLMVTKGYVI